LAAGTTLGALSSIPHDPATFSRGVLRAARAYFLDTYIDFPALAVAAAIALPFLRRDRPFWSVLFVAICGLVSLNAFEFDGGFLVPHRFLLLGLVSALIVTLFLSDGVRGPGLVVAALVAVGMSYSTWRTLDFALHRPRDASPNRSSSSPVYALPYNHMKLDGPISPERIRDAMTLARLGRQEPTHQVVLYGPSVGGESIVNPQWLMPRVLLSVGYDAFTERFTFVDRAEGVYFPLPIHK